MDTKDYVRVESALAYLSQNSRSAAIARRSSRARGSERASPAAGLHPLGRDQPEAVPAVSDHREREDAATRLPQRARHDVLDGTVERRPPPRPVRHARGHDPGRIQVRWRGPNDQDRISRFAIRRVPHRCYGPRHLRIVVRRRTATERAAMAELESHWPGATFVDDPDATRVTVRTSVRRVEWRSAGTPNERRRSDGHAHAALRSRSRHELPGTSVGSVASHSAGAVATYEDIASAVGRSGATRAVGSAIARNPVAYLIPCHRVIRKTGAFGGYHWGAARKVAMLMRETAGYATPRETGATCQPTADLARRAPGDLAEAVDCSRRAPPSRRRLVSPGRSRRP